MGGFPNRLCTGCSDQVVLANDARHPLVVDKHSCSPQLSRYAPITITPLVLQSQALNRRTHMHLFVVSVTRPQVAIESLFACTPKRALPIVKARKSHLQPVQIGPWFALKPSGPVYQRGHLN